LDLASLVEGVWVTLEDGDILDNLEWECDLDTREDGDTLEDPEWAIPEDLEWVTLEWECDLDTLEDGEWANPE